MLIALYQGKIRAGRVPGGTIVLSRERTERSRMIPSFRKKNERLERVLKNIGTISKRMERNGNCMKRMVKIVNAFLLSRTWERERNDKKEEQERNDLAEGPLSRTERKDLKKKSERPQP